MMPIMINTVTWPFLEIELSLNPKPLFASIFMATGKEEGYIKVWGKKTECAITFLLLVHVTTFGGDY